MLHTTKGFHVSYMENVLKWHHGVPTAEEYEKLSLRLLTVLKNLKRIVNNGNKKVLLAVKVLPMHWLNLVKKIRIL